MKEQFLKSGLLERNEVIFDFVFQYYYSTLCAFAETITKSDTAAEDIVQDCFVRLWARADEISIRGSLKNYLFTSVRNGCFDYLRHQKVKSKSVEHIHLDSLVDEYSPESWIVESELHQSVEQGISGLPPRCQKIFRMSRFDGLKNQEIADVLGLSKRTVELQITNALKALRQALKSIL